MRTKKIISILRIKRGLRTRPSRELQDQRRSQRGAPPSRTGSDERGGDGTGVDGSQPVANGRDESEEGRAPSTSTEISEPDQQIPDPNVANESSRGEAAASDKSSASSSNSELQRIFLLSPERAAGRAVDDGLNENGWMDNVVVDYAEAPSVCSCGALSVHTDDGLYWNWCCGRRVFAPEEYTWESELNDVAENEVYHPPREHFEPREHQESI